MTVANSVATDASLCDVSSAVMLHSGYYSRRRRISLRQSTFSLQGWPSLGRPEELCELQDGGKNAISSLWTAE